MILDTPISLGIDQNRLMPIEPKPGDGDFDSLTVREHLHAVLAGNC